MEHYDLVINTRRISLNEAINMIVALAKRSEEVGEVAKV
jgi:cytidylate kinase